MPPMLRCAPLPRVGIEPLALHHLGSPITLVSPVSQQLGCRGQTTTQTLAELSCSHLQGLPDVIFCCPRDERCCSPTWPCSLAWCLQLDPTYVETSQQKLKLFGSKWRSQEGLRVKAHFYGNAVGMHVATKVATPPSNFLTSKFTQHYRRDKQTRQEAILSCRSLDQA